MTDRCWYRHEGGVRPRCHLAADHAGEHAFVAPSTPAPDADVVPFEIPDGRWEAIDKDGNVVMTAPDPGWLVAKLPAKSGDSFTLRLRGRSSPD